MLINLTDVLTSEGRVIEKQVEIEMTEISSRAGTCSIKEKTPLALIFTNLGTNKASISGRMEIVLAMNCDRCLQPVEQRMMLNFLRTVTGPDDYNTDIEEDGQEFMDGYQLNAEDLIKDECFINLPTKVLCRPDCRGICVQCGKDLNKGECNCDTFVPDPRMARIRDIFDANKEV